MTYHASRIPLAVKQGVLQELTADDWTAMGLSSADFAASTWDAVTIEGKQYAVPLDTHPIVLYYNKDLLGHSFAIPANKDKEMTPEKRAAVLEVISWIEKNSLLWATAGHIPAYGPITESAEYKAMEPNATYSSLTANMIFDPKSPLAGVAGPMFDVMSTYFVPTLNGEMDPAEAVEMIKEELNAL